MENQSKLEIVRNALEKRAKEDIIIVNIDEEKTLTEEGYKFGHHLIRYWIAPKQALYLADELNNLMLTLVPGLRPNRTAGNIQNLSNTKDCFFILGSVAYHEEIGKEEDYRKRIITITDKHLEDEKGFKDGVKIIKNKSSSKLMRLIDVKVFPNIDFAVEGHSSYISHKEYDPKTGRMPQWKYIHLDDFKKYCPNIKKLLKKSSL